MENSSLLLHMDVFNIKKCEFREHELFINMNEEISEYFK